MEHLVCHEARSLRYAIKGGGEKKIAPTATKTIPFLWLLVQFFFTAPFTYYCNRRNFRTRKNFVL